MGNIWSGDEGFKEENGKQHISRGSGDSYRNPPYDHRNANKTNEVLHQLDYEFCTVLTQIRSMMNGKFDSSAREQLLNITGETEKRLHEFNMRCSQRRQEPPLSAGRISQESADEKNIIQYLKAENNKLREANKLLEAEKKYLDGLFPKSITSSQGDQVGGRKRQENPMISDEVPGRRQGVQREITEISDQYGPTKLGEMYNEIYENEWTGAFEQLQLKGYSEKECIDTLRMTLLNVIQFCQRKSEHFLNQTEEAVNNVFNAFRDKQNKARAAIQSDSTEAMKTQLKNFRKEVAESMVPLVQKAYLFESWSDYEGISALKPYIKKCLFLGWMLVVQLPPLALDLCEEGDKFDKEMYKEYTRSGPSVKFVVWPALLSHENGPVVAKGVAQGQK